MNLLRNVAVNGSATDRLLLLDVDFVPSTHLHTTLKNIHIENKEAIIVAAFEFPPNVVNIRTNISNKGDLIRSWDSGKVQPFK